MSKRLLIDQGFRAYSILLAVVAAFTVAWVLGYVTMASALIGYVWVGVAVFGALLVAGFVRNTNAALSADVDEARRRRFEDSPLTGTPLNAYLVALVVWTVLSVSWVPTGQVVVPVDVLGYGWIAIAAFGGFLTIGLAITHSEAIKDTVSVGSTTSD